jgi:mevalonate kinase
MLYGEHGVVYGAPCIVTAVDLRVRAQVELAHDGRVVLDVPGLAESYIAPVAEIAGGAAVPPEAAFVIAALRAFWRACRENIAATIRTTSDFTHSYGLGSSSAVTVATVKALAAAAGDDLPVSNVFRLSYEAVRDAQGGIGSGYDVATAAYGGTLHYVMPGAIIEPIAVMALPLVIGYSGAKASTTQWVRHVAEVTRRHPGLAQGIWQLIGQLVDEGRDALARGDFQAAGSLMTINQGLLVSLGVSTPGLDTLIAAARDAGAYGAKLSGAGGGDCMIALAGAVHRSHVHAAILGAGIPGAQIVEAPAGAAGVRIES